LDLGARRFFEKKGIMTLAQLVIKLSADSATLQTDFKNCTKMAESFASDMNAGWRGEKRGRYGAFWPFW
jgi:hypothetical protein